MNLLRSDARFCSAKCRVYANRTSIPTELKQLDRWVRWTERARGERIDKVPVTVAGRNASSTSPSTWTDFATVKQSAVGVGMGFVLNGDGVSCIDLDHCVTDGKPNAKAKAFMDRFPGAWVELSPSGTGLHIWGTAPAGPGRRTTIDGLDVEFYSTGRYITVTGKTVRAGHLRTPLQDALAGNQTAPAYTTCRLAS